VRITVVLPRGLSAARVRRKGIRVLIGSTQAAGATASLFQGKQKKALAKRRANLRAPGPVVVVLKPRKVKAGSFKVTVAGTGFSVTKRGKLKR
jgi:hypothetical protein